MRAWLAPRAADKREDGVLKRLRRRFVGSIMLLMGIVLVALVVISSANTQASLDELVIQSLDRSLEAPTSGSVGNEDANLMGMEHLAVLWVDLSSDGVQLGSNQSQVSMDLEAFQTAVNDAFSSDELQGRIESMHLTWKKSISSQRIRIAIADTTSIDASRNSQLATNAGLAIVALTAIFGIAELLARWMLRPVERAWEQQHQFVADASHELKTPLAVILANTQILKAQEEHIPSEDRRWIESCAEEAERMKGLVESLLELARTEEGAGTARRNVDVDLSGIVEQESLQFDAVAYELGCSIDTDIAEDLHVKGDPDQLGRLTKTLLDNACKYAATESTVTLRLERQGSWAELSVRNLGEPIPADDLPHVFDRFYRSDKARTRETGGFGLGLAIAKGIVESHGGKISVTSDAVSGTCFMARLPLASRQ